MTKIMPSLQNLIKLSYDAPAFVRAAFEKIRKAQAPVHRHWRSMRYPTPICVWI